MPSPNSRNPTQLEIAYAAGFFDGEGAVAISEHRSKRGTVSFRAHTAVMNTDRAVLEWLESRFGGNIYAHGFKAKPATWRPGYQWLINGADDCEAFLLALRPHLRIKGRLADNLLAFFALQRQMRPGKRMPPEIREQMGELHRIHHALVTRGKIEPSIVPQRKPNPQLELLNG